MKQVGSFSVEFHQFLDENAGLTAPLPEFTENMELLAQFYESMAETRFFDQQTIALQRTGQIGTYASILGQEAIGTAIGFALKDEDVFVPYYRDTGALVLRGVTFAEILTFWGGDERGNNYAAKTAKRDFPFCVPVATQVTHAAGVATALKIRHEAGAVLTTCGDGATSRGEFLESINLAGVWKLPLVIVINNNQWAISEPLSMQTRAKTLAQKAISAGIPGEQVDGNDVIALYDRIGRALAEARQGHGPTLIEAKTYRLGDHTTADDATRYRSAEEVARARNAEPIKRLRIFLEKNNYWDEKKEQALAERCKVKIDAAIRDYLAAEPQPVSAMFDYLYEKLPQCYEEQRRELIQKFEGENPPQ